MRVRIDLGYDGSRFFGSQRQHDARTVQGELERGLERLTGEPVRAALAGRTDQGVHAVGQVASADVRWDRGEAALKSGLSAVTPDDLAIYGVRRATDDFHARHSARSREYRYRIWCGPRPPVLLRNVVWHRRRGLDVQPMESAAEMLIGEKDFRSFAGKGLGSPSSQSSTKRQVLISEWRYLPSDLEERGDETSVLEYRIEANAFLPHMVRNIVGSLVDVGTGASSVDDFAALIETQDRRRAPAPAPPNGLVLWRVRYDEAE